MKLNELLKLISSTRRLEILNLSNNDGYVEYKSKKELTKEMKPSEYKVHGFDISVNFDEEPVIMIIISQL